MSGSEEEFDRYVDGFLENEPRWLFRRVFRDFDNPFEYFRDEEFRMRYRFRKDTVLDVLLPIVRNVVEEREDYRGLPIPTLYQLLVTLRYYATGSFQVVLADIIKISQPTVSRIIKIISKSICLSIRSYIKFPINVDNNMQKFYEIAEFPGVIACVDGTHIKVKNPGGPYAEVYRNRKRFFSLNVQVTCGPELDIYDVVADRPGSNHDSRIFDCSTLKRRLLNREINGILLGDNGYSNEPFLLTPFQEPVTEVMRKYNESHIKTRNVIERTIGVWKRRFPCLKSEMATKLTTTSLVIVATCILYNISRFRQENDLLDSDDSDDSNIVYNARENQEGLAFRNAFAIRHFS